MSDRGLVAGFQTATEAASINLILMAQFEFPSGDVNVWTGYGNLVYAGDTYVGVGDLGNVGTVEEALEVAAKSMIFSLSGIPSALIALALTDNYQGRPARLFIGALDSSGAIIADPYEVFSGRMDVIEVQDGGDTATFNLTAESRLIDLNRSRERRYTDEDQRIDYPTDEGLKFIAGLQDKTLYWGQKVTSAGAGENFGSGQEE